ncbi:hypothetical protein [uncultured Sanguibacteroides sp.]|uniref:golvesin C-terminal-like domain-containing protein n=2 Tax=uncultured Sanguibacteroides sp. TaxID=1635151 RepID=UPI00280391ED|nr:hypothetical protein [uncultured Sanguibacteroides sp.]
MAGNMALSCVLLLGLLYFFLDFGRELFHGVFDVLAITLPNTFSDVTGFAGLGVYLSQRASFLAYGCGLIMLGVTFVHRLPPGTRSNFSAGRPGLWLLALGVVLSGFYAGHFIRRDQEREAVRETFARYEGVPRVSVTDHDIEFKQEGYAYSACSKLNLQNIHNRKIDSVVLYLNPGLEVVKLTTGGEVLPFRRERQVLIVPLSMEAGETRRVEMEYGGSISPAVCYAEVVNIDSLAMTRRYYMYNTGQNYFYLQPDYTLLTPECLWYPSSIPPVNVDSPYLSGQDYTRFTLRVKGERSRAVISQGEETREGDCIRFVNKVALPGLTLCAGDYTRKSARINGVLYELFLFKGHEYLVPEEITAEEAVDYWEGMCRYRSKDNKVTYAFDKLCLVETPVHFCAHGRDWKTNSERVQPEIIFRPEREALFWQAFRVESVLNIGNTPAHEFLEMYMRELVHNTRYPLAGNVFFNQLTGKSGRSGKSEKNEGDISYLLQKYHYSVYSPEFAGINLLFHYMQEGFDTDFVNWGGGRSLAARYLLNRSLEDALHAPDNEVGVKRVLLSKGYNFLKYILCSVSREELERFNTGFMQRHVFRGFSYEEYCGELEKEFGVSLLNLTRELYRERGLPAYYFRDARVDDVEAPGGKEGFVFSIKAWNKGKCRGILSIRRRYVEEGRHYLVPAGACKEIKVYFEGPSDRWTIMVETNGSQNVPSHYAFEPFAKKGRIKEPVDGFFDADTLAFAPESGVYVVDNDDPGCRVVENSRTVQKLRRQTSYKNTRWSWMSSNGAYGELSRSYLEKKSGKGDSDVEWEVDLPEAGAYELFVYNNKSRADDNNSRSFYSRGKKKRNPVQRYRFVHAGGVKEVDLDLLHAEDGWASLGRYRFPAGKARVTLRGKGVDRHQYLYADAVKWVRVE